MPFRSERLFPLRGPQFPGMLALMALELGGDPKQRAENGGAIISGQIDDAGLDDETAEFNQMSGAFAAVDLPGALRRLR